MRLSRPLPATPAAGCALTLSACATGQQHSWLVDQGVDISRADYEKLCKTYRGEWGNKIDRATWDESETDKIYRALERDDHCSPD